MFLLELEISVLVIQGIHQNETTVLGTFCCHDYGGNPSEEVQKITADKKD